MGGGKALVNAYYRSAERLGVQLRYDTPVDRIELDGERFVAAWSGERRFPARACVLAAGGFESNREWLREAWGQNADGEWPADNFAIRGTRSALRDGQWLFHRSRISVTVAPPIEPDGTDWGAWFSFNLVSGSGSTGAPKVRRLRACRSSAIWVDRTRVG